MQRYIGLDVGTKRIGVALSDPLLITAQPLEAIAREPEEQSLLRIAALCKEHDVLGIVVGFPKNMNGTVGPQAEDCKTFGDKIKNMTGLEVFFEDERLTSKQAEQALALQGKKYTKNKSLVDITSAVLILQQFLDRRSLNMSEEKLNECESNIIKTEDEDGNIHSFELIDVVAMGDQEYGVLIYLDEEGEHDEDEEQEIVIMKLIKEDDGYVFESIDDDEEFNRVAMFIEEELNSDALDDEDEEDEEE